MDDAERLLIEVNERTKSIRTDLDAHEAEIVELRGIAYGTKNRLDNLVQNGNFLLNSLIDRRIEEYLNRRGLTRREWMFLILGIISTSLALIAYVRPSG